MKIEFKDKSYISCQKSEDGKIVIMVSAKDGTNPLKRISHTVELTSEQFEQLISDVR